MDYTNIYHIPFEDEEMLYCADCVVYVSKDEYKESKERNYEYPKCFQCMVKDEVREYQMIDNMMERGQ